LTAAGYEGLAQTTLSLGDLLNADSALGTPSSVATSNVSALELTNATVTALNNKGDTSQAAQVAGLMNVNANQTVLSSSQVNLGEVFGVTAGTGQSSAVNASADVLHILASEVDVANGSTFISVPGTTISLPGLGSVTVQVNLISAPGDAGPGGVGTTAKDTQAKVEADVTITMTQSQILTGLGSVLSGLTGVTASGQLSFPIVFSGATAKATVTGITCAPGLNIDPLTTSPGTVTMSGTTQALNVTVGSSGSIGTVTLTAPLGAGSLTANIADQFSTTVLGSSATLAPFTTPFIANTAADVNPARGNPASGTPLGNSPQTIGMGSTTTATSQLDSALNANLPTVTATGTGVLKPAATTLNTTTGLANAMVATVTNGYLTPLMSDVVTTLVPDLSPLLGLDVGGADVWNTTGVTCSGGTLVK
jgi:hypothetical protein